MYPYLLTDTFKRKFAVRNYNALVLNAPGAEQVAERSGEMKQAVFHTMTLSRSL
jgi:hypothetical protein